MMQLLVYCPKVTPRIKYIYNFIFREILLCDFEFTSILEDFKTSNLPKFSYANTAVAEELHFSSVPFLLAYAIEPIEIKQTTFGDQQVPFAVKNSALPFDIFAASFYFLSRYEEYMPFEADEHGRFPAEKSLQFKLGLLKYPVIDGWALILKNILLKKFPQLRFNKREFKIIPTIDVDRAFHFRSSGLIKNTTRIVKAAINLDTTKILAILKTGLGQSDPFDTYDYLAELHQKYQLKPIFFFLLSDDGHDEYDQNLSPEDEAFRDIIIKVAKNAEIGIHPSYASNAETKKITEELATLERIIHQKIDAARQHFLKLHLPRTYLKLIKAGINHDYSMGYSSQIGYRAGTCTPFFWYDLQLEKQSHLKIHPFAVMDVTLKQYLKLSPAEAIVQINELINQVKLINGVFSTLWHNESLADIGKWTGWKTVYEQLLANASK